jgi:hypothetical protein
VGGLDCLVPLPLTWLASLADLFPTGRGDRVWGSA